MSPYKKPFSKHQIAAFHSWMEENGRRTMINVDTQLSTKVQVPVQYLDKFGRVNLNISSFSTANLRFEIDGIYFSARFNRISHDIFVPYEALTFIYDPEGSAKLHVINGEGVHLTDDVLANLIKTVKTLPVFIDLETQGNSKSPIKSQSNDLDSNVIYAADRFRKTN